VHERRARQLVVAIVLEIALAGLTAPPSHGQGSDSSLAHLALAVLYDASAFAQDSASVAQVGAIPGTGQFRMNRAIVSGMVKVPHPWRYLVSVEFNGATQKTTTTFSIVDLAVVIPIARGMELSLGRQKEGLTEQMMASTRTIPMTERSAPLTAFFPTRDDGARLIGGDARRGRWSVGWFNPELAAAGAMASGVGVDALVQRASSVAAGWLDSESLRVILEYGYGTLKRAGSVGHTQFFTARVQWELR
jgi:hypothetical protein